MQENSVTGNYILQLDGLRFFAVGGVMSGHWLNISYLKNINPFFASAGVNLFFVLSGFLITQILLQVKKNGVSTPLALKQFYIRRFLRIFPLYYFVIFAGRLIKIPTSETHFIWFFTYTTNILCTINSGQCGFFTHLWSLAVEEQFYIVFPFVILFVPLRLILKSFYIIIGLAFLSKVFVFFFLRQYEWASYSLTPCCFDCFGIGSILAFYKIFSPEKLQELLKRKYLFFLFLAIAVGLYTVSFLGSTYTFFSSVFYRLTYSIFCFWLIGVASTTSFKGVFKYILENKIITYLGKISYGIYVYHHFMPYLFSYIGWDENHSLLTNSIIYFLTTVLISTLSWFLFEKPINDLKRYFDYTRPTELKTAV
ncbi:acyltransferase [Niastella caeni]|uniref:Acyltransferase n=1 Tax=Niastella caeni TaxID=2569763 RepID=A0A4S8I1G5_9BACT|nr:acyltransferase [Niastella caeni]THU41531.1 acyltransferase [Niastella caeni]